MPKCVGRVKLHRLPKPIQVGSFAYDPLEEAAMPLILTFPPLCPLPLTKGGAYLFILGKLMEHLFYLILYIKQKRRNLYGVAVF